ncbi:YbaB/EbfC family nucleoid-associated protein [Micromonospora sp. NPDC003197]
MTSPNLDDVLQQASALQDQLAAMRDNLVEIEVTGTSRGGAVAVRMTVGGEFQSVRIDPEVHAEGPEAVANAVLDALRDTAIQLREHATRQLSNLEDLFGAFQAPPTA